MERYKFYKKQFVNLIFIIFLIFIILIGALSYAIYQSMNYDSFYFLFFIFIETLCVLIFYVESKRYIKGRLHYLNYIKKILSKEEYVYFDFLFVDFYTGTMRRELKKINKQVTISIENNIDNEPSTIKIRGIYCKDIFNQIYLKKNLIVLEDYLGEKSLRLFYKDIFMGNSLINSKKLIEVITNETNLINDKNLDYKNNLNLDYIKNKLSRKASLMQIDDSTENIDIYSSWFGKVLLGLPNEKWPTSKGEQMDPLCQINVSQLPYIPEELKDIEFITVFIGPNELPFNNVNGENWCLRSYKNINDLVPLEQINTTSQIISHPMKGQLIGEDYPSWDDFVDLKLNNKNINLPKQVEDEFDDCFKNIAGFKIGGWPTLLQSEIYWAPDNQNLIKPQFIFQIGSIPKCNFSWGDNGVGYFGRGTMDGQLDEWVIDWQCW